VPTAVMFFAHTHTHTHTHTDVLNTQQLRHDVDSSQT